MYRDSLMGHELLSKGEQTRAMILDHGLALASEIGLEGLSIGALAKAVGLSKSGLFRHFDSKENLQLQVLANAVAKFLEKVVAPAFARPRGVPRIRALFENWLTWSRDPLLPGGCPFISAANELDDRPGLVRDRLVAYQREWIGNLATAARMAIDEDQMSSDLDTEQFAYDFYSIILAYHHFSRLIRDPAAESRARKAFEQLLDRSLHR